MSVAVDPVCGMEVQVAPDALTTLIQLSELPNAAQPGRHQGMAEGAASASTSVGGAASLTSKMSQRASLTLASSPLACEVVPSGA